jgi:signal transduction histidine kinase
LRARITLGFGLGVLVLSGTFAAIVYFTTSSLLLRTERSSLQRQAIANAELVSTELYDQAYQPAQIIDQLATLAPRNSSVPSSVSLLYAAPGSAPPNAAQSSEANVWYFARGSPVTNKTLPDVFKDEVLAGGNWTQTVELHDTPQYVIGLQIPPVAPATVGAVYVVAFSLQSEQQTLRTLLVSLIAATLLTTLAGAVLGRWASGRALRPLRDAARASLAIASGQLDTRLEASDASDLAVLSSSFNRMVDRLQQRIERDTRFTSDVSHELRSPLTVLANSLSVLERQREELPERSQRALDLVGAEIRRFGRMVGDLLEISRIDAGSAEVDLEVVRLGELLERVARAIGRPHLPLSIDDAVAELYVAVDKRRFERVIANLADNADRYGGGATSIGAAVQHGTVRLWVDDEGPGVPVADRERVFERFARGSATAGSRGAGGGTGLGLALVNEHVKLMHGRAWVEDRPGGGARFVVELPLADPPERAELEGEHTSEPAGAPAEQVGRDRTEPEQRGRAVADAEPETHRDAAAPAEGARR